MLPSMLFSIRIWHVLDSAAQSWIACKRCRAHARNSWRPKCCSSLARAQVCETNIISALEPRSYRSKYNLDLLITRIHLKTSNWKCYLPNVLTSAANYQLCKVCHSSTTGRASWQELLLSQSIPNKTVEIYISNLSPPPTEATTLSENVEATSLSTETCLHSHRSTNLRFGIHL